MERIYERDLGKVRERAVRRALLPTLVIYNLLLITDIGLLPETARVATFLHFAVVTPGLIGLYILYFRLEGFLARQIAEAAIPVLICSQTLTVMALNDSPNAAHYQYFVPLILLFSNVNQRLEPRVANATTVAILAMYVGVLAFQNMEPVFKLAGLSFVVVAGYLGLSANLRAHRDARYAFLLRLREQVRLQAAEIDAMHDPLTGLGNRRYLAHFARTFPERDVASAILVDIDFFKAFNDFHGHGRGDDCIRMVAAVIDKAARASGGIGVRYGGEEFLMLLTGSDSASAQACAEAVRQEVETLALAHGRSTVSGCVTVSLGVATGLASKETFELLVSAADAALYAAKAGGRNRVEVAQAAVHGPAHQAPIPLRKASRRLQ